MCTTYTYILDIILYVYTLHGIYLYVWYIIYLYHNIDRIMDIECRYKNGYLYLMGLREHPNSRNLGGEGWGRWGDLNADSSVSFGPSGFNGSSGERYLRRISDYIWISMNLLQLFYSRQTYTFREAKSGLNMSSFVGVTWTNFLLTKSIHIWQLSLNSIERFAKSKIFENTCNIMKNRHFCEI